MDKPFEERRNTNKHTLSFTNCETCLPLTPLSLSSFFTHSHSISSLFHLKKYRWGWWERKKKKNLVVWLTQTVTEEGNGWELKDEDGERDTSSLWQKMERTLNRWNEWGEQLLIARFFLLFFFLLSSFSLLLAFFWRWWITNESVFVNETDNFLFRPQWAMVTSPEKNSTLSLPSLQVSFPWMRKMERKKREVYFESEVVFKREKLWSGRNERINFWWWEIVWTIFLNNQITSDREINWSRQWKYQDEEREKEREGGGRRESSGTSH